MKNRVCGICRHPMEKHWTDPIRGTNLVRTGCPAPPAEPLVEALADLKDDDDD